MTYNKSIVLRAGSSDIKNIEFRLLNKYFWLSMTPEQNARPRYERVSGASFDNITIPYRVIS